MAIRFETRCSEETAQASPQGEDLFDFAQSAGADKIADMFYRWYGSILGSGLEYSSVTLHGLDQPASFLNRYRDRLLALYVVTRLHRID